ncbi:MAG: sigma factor-like helix-turn-helix DNA-binding protein [Planctomycetota bacterium]|jgi:predicted DNA-binding protein (UPF0251 family)
MGEGDPLFRAVHLELDHWNNIPDGYRIHSPSNRDSFRKEQELNCSRAVSFLSEFMAEHLTSRQFEVMRLYHLDYQLTQDAVGQVLGIRQSTVNQHLNGKKRAGKRVGGAYRRIRKQVCNIAEADELAATDRRVVHFLESLIRPDVPLRRKRRTPRAQQ